MTQSSYIPTKHSFFIAIVFMLLTFSHFGCHSVSFNCQLPPSVLCSSREAARACQVDEHCDARVWSQQSTDDRVKLAVYMECLCPDTKNFVNGQLWSTYLKLATIMDLHLVPYGNAREHQEGGKWVFECQHGEMECQGNLIQTCAIHIHNHTQIWFPFIACMEKSNLVPVQSAKECAEEFGVDIDAVMDCTKSSLGNQLEHEMALETEKLEPPHDRVPWVTLNGVHTEQIEQEAESDLTKLICETYKGSLKPDACVRHSNRL